MFDYLINYIGFKYKMKARSSLMIGFKHNMKLTYDRVQVQDERFIYVGSVGLG